MKLLRRVGPYVLLLLLFAAIGTLWIKHVDILDYIAQRNYQPSAEVQQLVVDTGLTPYGKKLFYINRPVIEARDSFNKHCKDPSDQVSVLGCFTGNRHGIYLYDITDARLNGIKQVTAAHEMLHQAYLRMNGSERTRINGLLQQYYDLKAPQALKDQLANYKQSEPDQMLNEMHSIFGTEAPELSPELETYYAQFFASRQKIIAFYTQYQSEFDKRVAQLKDLEQQLTALKADLEASKIDLEARSKTIKQQRAALDAQLAAGQIAAHDAAVPGYNATVDKFLADVDAFNSKVHKFNDLLNQRNQLAVQERQLEDAINSNVAPVSR